MKRKVSVVGAVIFNDKSEILCALRSSTMTLPNYWEFPGGKIDEGEGSREALIREIKEELDCTITVSEKIKEVEHEYESIIVHLTTYKAEVIAGIPKALEHTKLEWIHIQDLEQLKWAPADIPTVKRLLI